MVSERVSQTVLLASTVTVITVLGAYFYNQFKKHRIPTQWVHVGNVKKVYLYPLKSGNRIELKEAQCTVTGLRQTTKESALLQLRDRCLVVYGPKDGEVRTARTYPKMLNINVSVRDQDRLAIDAPNMETLCMKIPTQNENKETLIQFWKNEKINGIDCGDEAAAWISSYLFEKESGLRLAYNDDRRKRDISKSYAPHLKYYKNFSNSATGIFSDLASIHMINQASVDDMNGRIANSSTSCENFRPNIIVDGANLLPYVEDKWNWIKIGSNVIVQNVMECTRCSMVTINADTKVKDTNHQPLKTLGTYRASAGPDKSPVMGVFLGVKRTGILQVGDPIFVGI